MLIITFGSIELISWDWISNQIRVRICYSNQGALICLFEIPKALYDIIWNFFRRLCRTEFISCKTCQTPLSVLCGVLCLSWVAIKALGRRNHFFAEVPLVHFYYYSGWKQHHRATVSGLSRCLDLTYRPKDHYDTPQDRDSREYCGMVICNKPDLDVVIRCQWWAHVVCFSTYNDVKCHAGFICK